MEQNDLIVLYPGRSHAQTIKLFASIQAGKPTTDETIFFEGDFDLHQLLIWHEEQFYIQVSSIQYCHYGIDMGDLVIIHPSLTVKPTDMVFIQREQLSLFVACSEVEENDQILGVITAIVNHWRLPHDLTANIKHRRFKLILHNYQAATFDIGTYLTQDAEEIFMLKVKGTSMIEAGIEEDDIVVCVKGIPARSGDLVAAETSKGYTLKCIRYRETSLFYREVDLEPANKAFEKMPFHSAKDVNVKGVGIAVLRLLRKLRF